MLQDERHLTTEQISALLDHQLSSHEQELCEAHLVHCARCQQEQDSLRQVVTLLRKLPPVDMPRSFLLPLDTTIETTPSTQPVAIKPAIDREPVPPIPLRSRQPSARLKALRGAVRTLSTLAAVIGTFFVIASLLAMLHLSFGGGATATSMSSIQQEQNYGASQPASPDRNTSTPKASSGGQTPAVTITDHGNTQDTGDSTKQTYDALHEQSYPRLLIFDLNTNEGRLSAGALLLLLSVMGFVITRRGDTLGFDRRKE